MRLGMTIDTVRCIGCQTCTVACKVENNLPQKMWWNRVLTFGGEHIDTPAGSFPHCEMSYRTVACQHCENPACVKACPVGATYKDAETGIVMQDYDKCLGCRICIAACPYTGVRSFNWDEPSPATTVPLGADDQKYQQHQKHTVEKCVLCAGRVERGLEPACIAVCPERARAFGDFDDPDSEVSRNVRERQSSQLLPGAGTNPSVYYLS